MVATKLTLLNTSILTSFGTYTYEPLSLEEARALVGEFQREGKSIQSAIGHQTTADLLSALLGIAVAVNRTEYQQTVDDAALIFKLKGRPPEGKVLSREELEEMGYEFGLLTRKS
ncbi:MAG: hypothetical protein AUG51_08780 [Acidobacteria bacterium 13_1_20CM_3_53_8]|nr:MAG: hypothetical protein AUG51_08780 [Acidobacteria bacterium 13_1_20CM_3_53_8]